MGDVPCNGCTLCCRAFMVPLQVGSEIKVAPSGEVTSCDYEWGRWFENGKFNGYVLWRDPDTGACSYLTDKGCSIHDRRPQMCRDFDCRVFFKNHNRHERKALVKKNGSNGAIFARARELIGV